MSMWVVDDVMKKVEWSEGESSDTTTFYYVPSVQINPIRMIKGLKYC